MKKLGFKMLTPLLLALFMMSCDKEKMEMRRTTYFTTQADSLEQALILYVDDEMVGVVPYFGNSLTDQADISKALKYEMLKKKIIFSLKNSLGEELVKGTLETSKYRAKNKVAISKGTCDVIAFDIDDFAGVLVNINP